MGSVRFFCGSSSGDCLTNILGPFPMLIIILPPQSQNMHGRKLIRTSTAINHAAREMVVNLIADIRSFSLLRYQRLTRWNIHFLSMPWNYSACLWTKARVSRGMYLMPQFDSIGSHQFIGNAPNNLAFQRTHTPTRPMCREHEHICIMSSASSWIRSEQCLGLRHKSPAKNGEKWCRWVDFSILLLLLIWLPSKGVLVVVSLFVVKYAGNNMENSRIPRGGLSPQCQSAATSPWSWIRDSQQICTKYALWRNGISLTSELTTGVSITYQSDRFNAYCVRKCYSGIPVDGGAASTLQRWWCSSSPRHLFANVWLNLHKYITWG